MSGAELASLRELAAKVIDGTVVLTGTSRLADAEIVERLTTVRGIGRWTAEMFLMFELRRLDVWPVDDLGVRKGYGLAWRLFGDADGEGAGAARRAVPPVPLGGRPLLLGGGGDDRAGCPDPAPVGRRRA